MCGVKTRTRQRRVGLPPLACSGETGRRSARPRRRLASHSSRMQEWGSGVSSLVSKPRRPEVDSELACADQRRARQGSRSIRSIVRCAASSWSARCWARSRFSSAAPTTVVFAAGGRRVGRVGSGAWSLMLRSPRRRLACLSGSRSIERWSSPPFASSSSTTGPAAVEDASGTDDVLHRLQMCSGCRSGRVARGSWTTEVKAVAVFDVCSRGRGGEVGLLRGRSASPSRCRSRQSRSDAAWLAGEERAVCLLALLLPGVARAASCASSSATVPGFSARWKKTRSVPVL